VLDLEQGRVAIVVGDVVGQGAAAAAVMGQLRTALAAALLHGDSPAAALEHLDRLAARIPGARTSTAAVAILELETGQLCWARAGHPPPLLLSGGTARYLTGGLGAPLGIACRTPLTDATTCLQPGQSLLLYTDGLVERRHRIIDESLEQLAATAAPLHGEPPHALVTQLLAHALPETGPPDDIALITARYLPGPLHQRLPTDPAELTGLRRTVRAWIRATALPAELGEDLHVTLGEAAANAAEHAYLAPDEPGEFTYQLTHCGDGAIEVEVRDFGRWRPEPTDNHHRGRGLSMIRQMASDVIVDPTPTGTYVGFRLLAPPADPEPPPPHRDRPERAAPPAHATLHVHLQPDGGRRLALHGEVDLTSVTTLRASLLEQLPAPGPVTLDLTALDYLSSAGVGLLIDATHHAAAHHVPFQIQLSASGIPARILALSGLDNTLPLIFDSSSLPRGLGETGQAVDEHEGAGCGSQRDDEGGRVAELGSDEASDRPGDHDAEIPERGHGADRRTRA
jgi:anti-anti-sigma factor